MNQEIKRPSVAGTTSGTESTKAIWRDTMSVATIKSPDKFSNAHEAKAWLKELGYKLVREVWINENQSNRCAELTMLPASGKAKVNVFLQG